MDILQLAQEIAEHLPGGEWAAEKGHNGQSAYLRYGGEKRIHLHGDGYDWERSERLEIWGFYPKYDDREVLSFHGRKRPRITVAISRGAKAIARDVERRFLPGIWPLVSEAWEIVERYTRRDRREERNAQTFAAILGGEIGSSPIYYAGRHRPEVHFRYGSAEIGEETAALSLRSIPLGLALTIAQAIADYEGKERGDEKTN